jgi:aminopeptidase
MSPNCRASEGTYYSDLPSYKGGNYVKGVHLTFKNGEVVKVEAEEGGDFAQKIIMKTDKFSNLVGEFAIVDKRFSKIDAFMANTLFDENFGGKNGSMHIACGASYPDSYDGNSADLTKEEKSKLGFSDSALHWDLVNTEDKVVTATLNNDKEVLIYEKGKFQL